MQFSFGLGYFFRRKKRAVLVVLILKPLYGYIVYIIMIFFCRGIGLSVVVSCFLCPAAGERRDCGATTAEVG